MLKCAILTPGFLPVPAVNGGGVEQLISDIISDNEDYDDLYIDLYTIGFDQNSTFNYKNTNVIQVFRDNRDKTIYKFLKKLFFKFNIPLCFDSYYEKIFKILKNKRYDYIIIENNMYLYKYIHSRYNYSTRFIFHLHNDIGLIDKPYSLTKYIGNTAYKVLVVSNFLKKRFESVSNNAKIDVLYNCVDINHFKNISIKKEKLKNILGLSNNDKVILFCGRFEPEKGLLELIKAFNYKVMDNVKLVVVGGNLNLIKNEYYQNLKDVSNNNIIYSGFVNRDNISSYFNIADIVVIPTIIEEAFGLVAIEAMSLSKPIIATDSGGLLDLVDVNNGIVVNRDENLIKNLSSAIQSLVFDQELCVKLGSNGYDKLLSVSDFSKDNYYLNFVKKIR